MSASWGVVVVDPKKDKRPKTTELSTQPLPSTRVMVHRSNHRPKLNYTSQISATHDEGGIARQDRRTGAKGEIKGDRGEIKGDRVSEDAWLETRHVMGGSCRVPSYDARCVHRCTRHESYGLGFAGTLLKRLPDLLYLLHHSIQLIHKSLVTKALLILSLRHFRRVF
jgi:hypothetical protein